MPSGIVTKEVDKISGYPSHDGWPLRREYFIKGTEPSGSDTIHTKLKVCKSDSGKLAPDTLVAKGDYEEKEFIVLKEEDPLSSDKNRWQEGIDAWIGGQSDSRYHYPKGYCDVGDEVVVKIKKPKDKDQVGNEFEVEVEIAANYKIKEVKFYIDDDLQETLSEKPFKTKLVLADGIYNLKVKAKDEKDNTGERQIKIGVNKDPQPSPSPSPSPSLIPSPSPLVSPTPSPSP